MATRLEKLLKKEQQLKAQIQQAQAIERTKQKKQDTRRKFLVGAAILAQVESGEFEQENLLTILDAFLTRPSERELFGLPESRAGETIETSSKRSPKKQAKRSTGASRKTTRRKKATAKSSAKKATAKTQTAEVTA